MDPSLINYKNKRDELMLEKSCLLWGFRVVVPAALQGKALRELHKTTQDPSWNDTYEINCEVLCLVAEH